MEFVDYGALLGALGPRRALVFGGFSGSGYGDLESLRKHIRRMVAEAGDHAFYLGGATRAGIGWAYELVPAFAAELGFRDIVTAGIASRNAPPGDLARQSYVLYVDTPRDDWRVLVDGRSLFVDFAADSRGVMIYFGGGAVARSELLEAASRDVPAVFVPLLGRGSPPGAICEDELPARVRRWRGDLDGPLLPS